MKADFPARIRILSASHLCRNPRVLKEATALAVAGYQVTVQTVDSHAPSQEIDRQILATAPFAVHYLNCRTGVAGAIRRLKTSLARKYLSRTGREHPLALGPTDELLRRARSSSWDLLIGHTEPALWCATQLLRAQRTVAADLEDWHSEDLPLNKRSGRPCRLLRNVEKTLLEKAAYVTTTSASLAAALQEDLGGKKAQVIYNAFPLQETDRTQTAPNEPPAPLSMVWFSQTVGPDRGLEAFLMGWVGSQAPSRLTLLGTVAPAYRERIGKLVPSGGPQHLRFQPAVSPDDLPGVLAEHDVGLALEVDHIRNRDLTITNKMLQYFNAGLAVIATPTRGQQEVLAAYPDAGWEVSLDQPDQIGSAVQGLAENPVRLRRMQRVARQAAVEKYCWEHQSKRLLELVKQALGSPS